MSYLTNRTVYGAYEKQVITPDGVKDEFLLNYRPGRAGALLVSLDGTIQEPNSAYYLTEGGTKIKFTGVPKAGSSIFVMFLGRELSVPVTAGSSPVHDSFIGNGIQKTFTLTVSPAPAALQVFKNGTLQSYDINYTLSGNQITFADWCVPWDQDTIDCYINGVERTDLVTVDPGSITANKLNLPYINYYPSISTTMTTGIITYQTSKYMLCGKFVRVRLVFSVKFYGTAANYVRVTLPDGIPTDGIAVYGRVTLSTDTLPTVLESGIIVAVDPSTIDIKRTGAVNYTLNPTTWTFAASFEYDIA